MLGHRRAVDRVVGGHDAPRVGVGDDELEGRQVELAQGALAHHVVHREAVGLGVVGDEVLDGGADAAGLDAAHVPGADPAGEVRVLAVRLEVAAAERRAVQVDRGGEQHVDALAAGLLGEEGAGAAGQLGVPGGGQRGRGGERHGGVVGGPADSPDADRAVGHDEGVQADLRQGGQGPHVPAGQEAGLGVQVEPAQGRFDDCLGVRRCRGSRHGGASSLKSVRFLHPASVPCRPVGFVTLTLYSVKSGVVR